MAADVEFPGERVDRLGADAVQADAELENVVVIFRTGVDLRNALDDFAQRNAASEIAHGDCAVFDGDLNFLSVAHDEFVDRVIDHFLHQNVATVVVVGAVPDAPDVHAGAQADVLQRGERLDFAFVVNVFLSVSHN